MLFASLLLGATLAASAPQAPPRQVFDPKRDPQRDLWAAMDAVKGTEKRILLDVGGEWCGWCHLLDRTISNDPALSSFLASRFVVVKVNFSPENRNQDFLSCFPEIAGYPHLFVLDRDGKLVCSQSTDVLESGKGYDRALLMEFFRRWSR
jgi:thioredoxin-related protein